MSDRIDLTLSLLSVIAGASGWIALGVWRREHQDRSRHQDPPTHQRPTPEDGDVHAGPVAGADRTSADHVRWWAGVCGPPRPAGGSLRPRRRRFERRWNRRGGPNGAPHRPTRRRNVAEDSPRSRRSCDTSRRARTPTEMSIESDMRHAADQRVHAKKAPRRFATRLPGRTDTRISDRFDADGRVESKRLVRSFASTDAVSAASRSVTGGDVDPSRIAAINASACPS